MQEQDKNITKEQKISSKQNTRIRAKECKKINNQTQRDQIKLSQTKPTQKLNKLKKQKFTLLPEQLAYKGGDIYVKFNQNAKIALLK